MITLLVVPQNRIPMFNELLHVDAVMQWPMWFVWYLLYMVVIYAVCSLIDQGKQKLLNKPINKILD